MVHFKSPTLSTPPPFQHIDSRQNSHGGVLRRLPRQQHAREPDGGQVQQRQLGNAVALPCCCSQTVGRGMKLIVGFQIES